MATDSDSADDVGTGSWADPDVFDAMANGRRRLAILILDEIGEPVSLRRLADLMTAVTTGDSFDSVDGTESKRVYIAMYQQHLPKLAEIGVIDIDDRVHTAWPNGETEAVAGYVRTVLRDRDPDLFVEIDRALAEAGYDTGPSRWVPPGGWRFWGFRS